MPTDPEILSALHDGSTYTVMAQCRDETGTVGSWLRHDGLMGRVSPTFPDLAGLYPWLHANGYTMVPGSMAATYTHQ